MEKKGNDLLTCSLMPQVKMFTWEALMLDNLTPNLRNKVIVSIRTKFTNWLGKCGSISACKRLKVCSTRNREWCKNLVITRKDKMAVAQKGESASCTHRACWCTVCHDAKQEGSSLGGLRHPSIWRLSVKQSSILNELVVSLIKRMVN